MNGIKRVVLCADDFGLNEAIDTGIIRLAEQGRLSATSCLVHGPTFVANAPALKQVGIQVGLHLNFTEPLGSPGLYLPLARLVRRSYLRTLDAKVVRAQIESQFDAFHTVMGRAPHFVDGHQHIHQLPQIRNALIATLVQRYGGGERPWLRNTQARPGLPAPHRFKAAVIQALGAATLARQASRAGFYLNARFAGVYDFQGGEPVYRSLLAGWLNNVQDGDLLMCHPAARVDATDPMGAQRVAEFNVLASDATGRLLYDNKIQGRTKRFGAGPTLHGASPPMAVR